MGFTPEAEKALQAYEWPGNVRELWNLVERTALLAEGTAPVTFKGLAIPGEGGLRLVKSAPQAEAVPSLFSPEAPEFAGGYMELKKKWSESFEREYLLSILGRHHGNVSAAAREARLDRSNFLRLLRRHRIQAAEFRKAGAVDDAEDLAQAA